MVLLVYAFYDECLLIISTNDDGIWARNDFHRKSKRLKGVRCPIFDM